jgi:hypothetical protein
MGKEVVLREEKFDRNTEKRKDAITFVDKQFKVSETVNHLQVLMKEVTKDKISADTVNAACNCVQNLNLTIKTAIQASRFVMSTNGYEEE